MYVSMLKSVIYKRMAADEKGHVMIKAILK